MKLLMLVIVVLLSLLNMMASADIPLVIGYQGMITNNGSPVADGSYSMRFRIYDAAAAGGELEWDSGTIPVNLSSGIFSVLLGESPQPTINLEFDEDYWLLVTFDGVNQTPRQRLGSVGYAYMASGLVPGTEVSGAVITGTNAVISGHNTATNEVSYGLYGQSNSTDGTGVAGVNNSTEGYAKGVMGQSSSPFGKGVQGYNYSATGSAVAVGAQSHSSQGRAVYGYAQATEGLNYGVYGLTNSTQGRGVHGLASGTSGYCYGVYGESFSTGGAAGVYGRSPDIGVEGDAIATTGNTYGGYFGNNSDSGGGVYGIAWLSTTGDAIGVKGMTYSQNGSGVYGYHYDTGTEGFLATRDAGVYGLCSLTSGYGVYGEHDGGGLAGKFEGDVDVNGRLELPDNDATPTVGTGAIQIGDASRALKLDGNEIITNTGETLHIQRDSNGDLQVDNGTLSVDASLNRVGIGTSTPDEALTVYGRVYVSNMDGTSDGYTVRWYDNRLYYLVSSSAYKEDIQKLDDDFEAILKAIPRSFTDKTSGNRCIGFIAEEFDQLGLTNLVQYRDNEPHTVKYEMVSLYLLEVIKELKRKNEAFAERLAVLENK